ncbi:MAG: GAF domain-containing protein, partial [Casimicrobiaceae bacterium]
MGDLARGAGSLAFKVQASNRMALVQMRTGGVKAAVRTATAALKAARQTRQKALEAMSLYRLAEAQFRANTNEASARNAARAAKRFASLGQPALQGRALWALAAARSDQGRAADCDRAATEALALGRRTGDLFGAGNALNMLMFNEPDLATQLRLLSQSMAAFEAAGYVERQGVITYNLAITYLNLGLYRRARRTLRRVGEIYGRAGAKSNNAGNEWQLAFVEMEMGHLERVREHIAAASAILGRDIHVGFPWFEPTLRGRLAFCEHDASAAIAHYGRAVEAARSVGNDANLCNALAELARVQLSIGDRCAALEATHRAVEIHRAHDLAAIQGMFPAMVWWEHGRALTANGERKSARQALEMAYDFMRKGIAGLSDEGLRRNYLNKIRWHREIIAAWLADARRRKLAPSRRTAHLQGATNLREPFERLVDTGLRLNELRSSAELHEFLVDEVTELSGAERVLLVLEGSGGPDLAGSLVPQGEDAQALMGEVSPFLAEVRRSRAITLTYDPAEAEALAQRSRIVAPLIAQRELLGLLYADISGPYGRFHDADRDLLGMLAAQAAVALANAHWSQGLERKVDERTAELNERVRELEVINAIQRGLAAEMDFRSIVDLVGEKLREVFSADVTGIALLDRARDIVSYPFLVDHGERYRPQPQPHGSQTGIGGYVMRTQQAVVFHTFAELRAFQVRIDFEGKLIGGPTLDNSFVYAPLTIGEQSIGLICIGKQAERAFGDGDVNLITTVAASLSLALQNAQSFEAERQRAAELAIINAVQQELAGELSLQGVYDAVGDKVRDVFRQASVAIRIYDPQTDMVEYVYSFFDGKRYDTPSEPLGEHGFGVHVIRTGKTLLVNSEMETASEQCGSRLLTSAASPKSFLLVPLIIGGVTRGLITLSDSAREHAFSETDVRLLETLAGSMGVALENARLFDETQRLLKETERRSSELAVINSIQHGMAKELNFQAIVDLVGDKLR